MAVTVRCPNPACGRSNRFDESLEGQAVRCPICGRRYTLLGSTELAEPPRSLEWTTPSAEGPAPISTVADGATPWPKPDIGTISGDVGRYRIRRMIGSGAFGAVYRAYDPQVDRDVALKVPHPGVLESSMAVERFLREARAAGRLRHGHIVPVFDAGRDDTGHYYIASAYVPGMTLADLLADGPLPPRRAVELVRDVALALEHAHELGVVHRDVKTANVLIDANGTPLLTDFGLAQHRGPSDNSITEVGTVMGTPGYMSPEVASGISGDVPPASDQYSLGVILFELLCGRRPFQGPSHTVIYEKIEADAPSPRQFRPDLPTDLEAICLRCLARSPDDRYPSCGAFAAALTDWLDTVESPPSRPGPTPNPPPIPDADPWPSVIGPAPRPPRRRRGLGVRVPTSVRIALVTLAVWGAMIAAVVVLIRMILPDD